MNTWKFIQKLHNKPHLKSINILYIWTTLSTIGIHCSSETHQQQHQISNPFELRKIQPYQLILKTTSPKTKIQRNAEKIRFSQTIGKHTEMHSSHTSENISHYTTIQNPKFWIWQLLTIMKKNSYLYMHRGNPKEMQSTSHSIH